MAEQISKRSIIYEILLDTGQAKTDGKEAVATFEKFGSALEQNAVKAKSLTLQLREMKKQLGQLEFGSEQFTKLSIAAAKVEDRIQKINQRVRNLASETKNLDAFISIATGIAGGFAAAQGAIALFGGENEKLQKTLLKVQGSLAVLNGLQQLQATIMQESAAKTFVVTNAQKAYNLVVGASTGVLKSFRLALAGTGIGLAVIAITALYENWDKLTAAIRGSNKELDESRKKLLSNLTLQAETLEAHGQKAFEARRKVLEEERKQLIEGNELQGEELIKALEENNNKKIELEREYYKFRSDQEDKRKKEEDEKLKEAIKKGQEDRDAIARARQFQREQFNKEIEEDIENEERIHQQRLEDLAELEARKKQVFLAEVGDAPSSKPEDNPNIKAQELENELIQANIDLRHNQIDAAIALLDIGNQLFAQNAGMGIAFTVLAKGLAVANVIIKLQETLAGLQVGAAPFLTNPITAAAATALLAAQSARAKIQTGLQIATIAATAIPSFQSGKSGTSQNAQAFAEGTPYLDDNKAPQGKDTIPVWANRGEAIIPTEENMKAPGLAAAWINGDLEDYIKVNYVQPALAVKTIEELERDSMIDYSNRFYRQLLATAEGNHINKKALKYLSSIDAKINRTIPERYS